MEAKFSSMICIEMLGFIELRKIRERERTSPQNNQKFPKREKMLVKHTDMMSEKNKKTNTIDPTIYTCIPQAKILQ